MGDVAWCGVGVSVGRGGMNQACIQ
jgi:hypothetical protein